MTERTINPPIELRDVANAHRPIEWGRWLLWLVVLIVAANFAWIVARNENFGWPIVAEWFTADSILKGLSVTLGLTVVAMIIGTAIGLILAIARMSNDTLFSSLAGLSLNEAAYMAEIIRGGLLSVDKGQVEATDAFGMTRSRALRRIIIPQAMRSIIPPTGNQLISMIKATSLVSVIAMSDLLYSVQAVYNRTFEVIPMLMVAVIWYLVITSLLNVGQGFIERYYARGERGASDANVRTAIRVEEPA
nr:amino acid ABC transporter permease [Microvirga sp. VF16]